MGLSSNQARFLAITGRKCDIEYRMQNICQRRLNLANESQRTGQLYNDAMSNRKLFVNNWGTGSQFGGLTSTGASYEAISINNLFSNGYYVTDGEKLLMPTASTLNVAESGLQNIGKIYNVSNVLDYKVNSVKDYGAIVAGTISSKDFSTSIVKYNLSTETPPPSTEESWNAIGPVTTLSDGTLKTTYEKKVNTITTVSEGKIDVPLDQLEANFYSADISANTLNAESLDIMNEIVNDLQTSSIGNITLPEGVNFSLGKAAITDDDLKVVSYQTPILQGDGSYQMKNVNAISINSLDGFKAIMTKLQSTDDETRKDALKQNYVLNCDIDLSEYENWQSIGTGQGDNAFSGLFDGNGRTISNITQSVESGKDGGFFGVVNNGVLQNLNLDNINISGTGGCNGSLAGSIIGSNISNCNVNNANISGANYVGGLAGTINRASISISSISDLTLAGNATGSIVGKGVMYSISKIYANSESQSLAFVGKNEGSTHNISNSIGIGCIPALTEGDDCKLDNVATATKDPSNADNLIWSYWKDNVSGTNSSVLDAKVFDTSTTPPTFKSDYKTIQADVGEDLSIYTITTHTETRVDTQTPTSYNITYQPKVASEDLEAGLRDGTYKLARDADVYTQNPSDLTVNSSNEKKAVEFVDWRNISIISDDLDTSDDEEAQRNYENTIHNINEQDKILEMEMQKLDTEYTAINAERDSLTKILDTNTKNSFKYFS